MSDPIFDQAFDIEAAYMGLEEFARWADMDGEFECDGPHDWQDMGDDLLTCAACGAMKRTEGEMNKERSSGQDNASREGVGHDHSDCGCGHGWRKPKPNGTCATCGGWLPGERPPLLSWTTRLPSAHTSAETPQADCPSSQSKDAE